MTEHIQSRLEIIRPQLVQYGQQHLLRFIDRLSPAQLEELSADINQLDLPLIDRLIGQFIRSSPSQPLPETILPPPVYPIEPTADLSEKYRQARQLGAQLIAQNKVAALTVAGGMGTRLNFDGPKGCLPATPVQKKSLFQLFAESIQAAQNRFGGHIPWYIMTSSANHPATQKAFQENDHFQLEPDNIRFFQQGIMPCFNQQGKILLSQPHRLALSPDGHGGTLRALYNSGALADMAQKGIEYISYFQVDNPLVKPVDPLFIGLHALDQAEMSGKALIKTDPDEKVGVFVSADDRIKIIEYIDLPDELARQRNPDGRLTFELGSPAIHIINRNFVEKLNVHGFSLPWHQALKKVPFIDHDGQSVDPTEPNAIKLETFIFDALPLAKKSIILAVERVEEFAPIKNATGADSLQSSLKMQTERAAHWLEKAGLSVPRRPDQTINANLEISPLLALDAEELAQKHPPITPLKPGANVYID